MNLACVAENDGRHAEVEPLLTRAASIVEKALGPNHPTLAIISYTLARSQQSLHREDDAKRSIDRAITIAEKSALGPDRRYELYLFSALLAWTTNRREAPMAQLQTALDLAEEQRGNISGAERERATSFAGFARGFEKMVAWQMESGNAGAALGAMERSHARSLLDQIRTAGIDLDASRSAADLKRKRETEARLLSRVANLEWQLTRVDPNSQPEPATRLQTELAQARNALYAHERDARDSSPIYREVITRQARPPSLELIQQRLLTADDLMLVYLLGEEGGFLLALTRDSSRLLSLTLAPDQANTLGGATGPLTSQRLSDALLDEKKSGVMAQISDPKSTVPVAKLAALWQTLVPEPERTALTTGKFKRLIVVPDGPLTLLPFEALVVAEEKEPHYLLDKGPPIVYAPSAATCSSTCSTGRSFLAAA